MSDRRRCVLAIILAGSALALTGCNSVEGRAALYRTNPTPELDTLSQRHADIDNALTIMSDTNFRLLNEDIGRALYLNRPSRLTPTPIPY